MRKNKRTKKELKQASQKTADIVAIMKVLKIDPAKAERFLDDLRNKAAKSPKE